VDATIRVVQAERGCIQVSNFAVNTNAPVLVLLQSETTLLIPDVLDLRLTNACRGGITASQ
jgi:hypothetical protein